MTSPRYSMTWPMPPDDADLADDREDHVLGGHERVELAGHLDGHRLRLRLRQRLRGEHVLDLGRADAEGERAERAVRGRVAVAADDGHAGLRQPLLRADDVDDALAHVAHAEERNAELFAVLAQHLDLLHRERVGPWLVAVDRGDVVVDGGEREVGPANLAPGDAQALERLRRRHLVDEVEVDVEKVWLARLAADNVVVPDLLGSGARLCHQAKTPSGRAARRSIMEV